MNTLYDVPQVKLCYEAKECSAPYFINESREIYNLMLNVWDKTQISYKESFKVILLNHTNKVIGVCNIFEGGISGVHVDVRMVLQVALLSNASGIIIVHNHPSGQVRPSQNDNLITKQIQTAILQLNIKLLDHIIISNNAYYSYADKNEL